MDEDQAASEEEEAEHGLLLAQPSSGAAAEPLDEEEDADDEAPEELTFASAQAEAREEELRVRASARRCSARECWRLGTPQARPALTRLLSFQG